LKALLWRLQRASRPTGALEDPSAVRDVLDALAKRLDGTPAAQDYFSRRRRVMHRLLGHAVRKRRLPRNPLSQGNLREGWSQPPRPEDAIAPGRLAAPNRATVR